MANTYLAYPDSAINTDPDQDAEPSIPLTERKKSLLLETHPQMLVNLQTTLSGRKRCFLLYFEHQPLSATRTTLRTLLRGRTLEQNL